MNTRRKQLARQRKRDLEIAGAVEKETKELRSKVRYLLGREESLRAFAKAILDGFPNDYPPDGCEIQDIAEATGVFVMVVPSEPCGEGCSCAEFHDLDEFSEHLVRCYRPGRLLEPPKL